MNLIKDLFKFDPLITPIHTIVAVLVFIAPLIVVATSSFADSDTFVDDPEKLNFLEHQGFDFSRLALGTLTRIRSNKILLQDALYRSIVDDLEEDLKKIRRDDWHLSTTMHSTHRLFNINYLKSDLAFVELVGIIERLDRAPFAAENCGEIRFIYRLAYRTSSEPVIYSRLPMTFNVVYWISRLKNECGAAALQWQNFYQSFQKGNLNTLQTSSLPLGELKSIEVNLQSVRWPSTVRPNMAGYAEYLLRVFQKHENSLIEGTLENTPDIPSLIHDVDKKQKLLAWLRDVANLKSIDTGVVQLPQEFLARKATSVALNGVHRLNNAPFTQLYLESDFTDLDF